MCLFVCVRSSAAAFIFFVLKALPFFFVKYSIKNQTRKKINPLLFLVTIFSMGWKNDLEEEGDNNYNNI